jgi:hypothetical protein
MSASFDIVDEKLRETDFFLTKMEEAGQDVFAVRCNFSAFVTAARSVTFAIQKAMNDIPGFGDWYAPRQNQLRADPVSRFFTSVRNEVQKLGTNPVARFESEDGAIEPFFFIYWYGQWEAPPPDTDVLSACKQQMKTLAALVYEVYRDFGHFIDPAVFCTPDGAKRRGLTIEDLEEQLLGLSSFTASLPLDERFRLVRQNEPTPHIDDLFLKYLGHDRFGAVGRYVHET